MCILKIENIIQDVVSTRSTHFVSKRWGQTGVFSMLNYSEQLYYVLNS